MHCKSHFDWCSPPVMMIGCLLWGHCVATGVCSMLCTDSPTVGLGSRVAVVVSSLLKQLLAGAQQCPMALFML